MKQETIYVSEDGARFTSEKACLEWERLLPRLRELREEAWRAEGRQGRCSDAEPVEEAPGCWEYELRENLDLWLNYRDGIHPHNANDILKRARQIRRMAERLWGPSHKEIGI